MPGVRRSRHRRRRRQGPEITTIRDYGKPRTLNETEEGRDVARQITDLDALVTAYQEGVVAEADQRE